MKENFKDYTKTILNTYLNLQRGDALSVNTEDCTLEEAKYLANEAIKTTGANVKIVVTENGKPQDVIEFDAPDQLTTQITGLAMVRLVNGKTQISDNPDEINKENLPLLQKLGHLAQPLEVGRRIIVPWCVINVDEIPDGKQPDITEINYRQSYLRHWDIHTLHLVGKNTDFTIDAEDDIFFVGGQQKLSNGRVYLTGPDYDRLSFAVNKDTLNGKFSCEALIAGNKKSLDFTFKNGKLTDFTKDKVLEKLLSLDEDISKPGLLTLRDRECILSFGGADTQSLPVFPNSEEEIPSWFNTSLYTFKCTLDKEICINITDCEGKSRELIRKGYFVE